MVTIIATVRPQPDTDDLVTTALERLDEALLQLDRPLTVARKHVIRNHLAVAKIALLTPPLRPEEVG